MKTREEMIELLVDNDLHDWDDPMSRNEWLEYIFRHGFIGYETMTDEQLRNEFLDREFGDYDTEESKNEMNR
jgi:hypothetical protein